MIDRTPVGVGPRALAFLIDVLVLAVTITILDVAAGGQSASADNTSLLHANTAAVLLFNAAALVYFGGLESAWGATVGKRVLGLRVTTVTGNTPTGRAVFIRTLCRMIDMLPAFYAVGAILVWASPRRQRLGDRWAGTVVVRTRRTAG
jgi:uncharacterized RDD family membrane protein YckC